MSPVTTRATAKVPMDRRRVRQAHRKPAAKGKVAALEDVVAQGKVATLREQVATRSPIGLTWKANPNQKAKMNRLLKRSSK